MNKAERFTKDLLKDYPPERSQEGQTLRHAAWMMENLPPSLEKRNRWIGWAQCLAVNHGLITLSELMDTIRLKPGEEDK